MKKISIVFILVFISSCIAPKKVILDKNITGISKVNTVLNKDNYKARKTVYGFLDRKKLSGFILGIEESLQIPIKKGKTVVISFTQNGSNCILAGMDSYRISKVIDRQEKIFETFIDTTGIQKFLVYTKKSFFTEFLKDRKKWQLDTSGFINDKILKLKETCSGFIILRPSGEYCIYYGGDSFSFLKDRLEVKDWSDKKTH